MSTNRTLSLEEMEKIAGGAEDPIVSMTVTWEDEAGNKYSYTMGGEKKKTYDPIVGMSVTWQDGNGHTYSTACGN